jgi:hypothetical protein
VYVAAKSFFDAAIYAAPARRVDHIQALDGVFLACHRRAAEAVLRFLSGKSGTSPVALMQSANMLWPMQMKGMQAPTVIA